MSQSVSKLRAKARMQIVEKNIIYMTQEELAQQCGVDRRTIERDIEKWRSKGGFKRFLIKEFFELYGKEKLVNPSLALNRIMTLLLREESTQTSSEGKVLSIQTRYNQIITFSRDIDADPTTP